MWSVFVCLLRSCGSRFLPEAQLQVTVVKSVVTQLRFLGFWGGTAAHMQHKYF